MGELEFDYDLGLVGLKITTEKIYKILILI